MMTKMLAVVLAALLLPVASTATVLAATNDARQVAKKAAFTAKVKHAVAGLGSARTLGLPSRLVTGRR